MSQRLCDPRASEKHLLLDHFIDVQMCAHKHDIYIIITYQMFTLSKKKKEQKKKTSKSTLHDDFDVRREIWREQSRIGKK